MSEEKKEDEIVLEKPGSVTKNEIHNEEVSIEDLHSDLEKKLREQGFMFDKRKFIFEDKHLSKGEKIADSVARIGGSWKFIISFGIFLLIWIVSNTLLLLNKGWDPYPFILLNLCLSCLASIQAPIIMMSQNRQAQKDRKQEEINLEKDIVDFKQDRLDLILDQKEWAMLKEMHGRLMRIEQEIQGLKIKASRSPEKKNPEKKKAAKKKK
jgi:uncharacterized membrane protein